MFVLETNLPYKEKLSQIAKIQTVLICFFWKHGKTFEKCNMLDSVNAKIIKNVTKCSTWLKFKCPPLRPAVAFQN